MSVIESKSVNPEYIKVRWREPYVSHALNRKNFGNQPVGIYAGFGITNTGYRTYKVDSTTVDNIYGNPEVYNQGAHNSVSGYSVAVFQDTFGHSTSVVIPPGSVSGSFEFDFSANENQQIILAIDTDYFISNMTEAQILAIDSAEMVDNPEYIVIGVVNVPNTGVSGSDSDIDYNDSVYPRTLPFATTEKYGYMSPSQAALIAGIGEDADAVYVSDNDAEVYWFLDSTSGGVLQFTGNVDYRLPTKNFDVNIAVSGTSLSGIDGDDLVYFTYNTNGPDQSSTLQFTSASLLPTPGVNQQLVILGARSSNNWFFKTGQKWEVGEIKPFGVTSKFPNLRVSETGNPPGSDNVSGVFFDNAQVTVLPGGRDVRVFVNVSGSVPESPVEEAMIATAGQQSFTTTEPELYWINQYDVFDISVFRNGNRLIPYNESTSGLMDSYGQLVWGYKKTGTRTIETQTPVPENGVITIRLEANRGINAFEYIELVTATSGAQFITSTREFNPDNDVKDIHVYRNGQKYQYSQFPLDPLIHGCRKENPTTIEFDPIIPTDSLVVIRYEGTNDPATVSGATGNLWSDPVDSTLEPDTDGAYDLGQFNRFRNANFSGDIGLAGDMYIGGKLNVSGGIDPIYLQLNAVDPSQVPTGAIFIDSTNGSALTFKNVSGNMSDIGGEQSDEIETMQNPYPFSLTAPMAVSVSGAGNFFVITDYSNPETISNFFGILTENVSAFGGSGDTALVRWRGKMSLPSYPNGPLYVSGAGGFSEDSASVSGDSILQVGIVKNSTLFIRPTVGLNL